MELLGLFNIYGTQPQSQTQNFNVQQMMKRINAGPKDNQAEAQRRYADLFWTATTDKDDSLSQEKVKSQKTFLFVLSS